MINKILLSLFVVLLPISCEAGWFGPKDYDECILESMKGVTSDVAAKLIRNSCRDKFPPKAKKKPKTTPLSFSALSQLTGKAGLGFGNYFSGNIYNGNKDITVSEISIQFTTTSGGKEVTRTYTDDTLDIPPQSTANFGVSIVTGDEGSDYSWNIVSAEGY